MRKSSITALMVMASFYVEAKDFPMGVTSTSAGESVTSAPASGMVTRSGKNVVTVKLNNTCFGTNLRGVANPLASNSLIRASFELKIGGKNYPFSVEYPAAVVSKEGMVLAPGVQVAPMNSSKYSIPTGGSAAIYGNSIVLNTSIPTGVTIDNSGAVSLPSDRSVFLKSYSFRQVVQSCDSPPVYGAYGHSSHRPTYACGQFMGKNGNLSASFGGISVSSDNSSVEINVAFPGETGFCGSYWSPLMVFFDKERPRFENSSSFPLNPIGKTMWPEADAPGWFVALDRNKSGQIESKDELFGESSDDLNGFEVLKKLDTNKDGFIDHRDKQYKKLVLWNDKNGDGVSQASEMIKLHTRITKISLAYEKGTLTPIGAYAEARERSKFWYKEQGSTKEGTIIDIWLAPEPTKLTQR